MASNINPPEFRFDVLVYQEDDLWVAHCLQLDVVGTSKMHMEEATERLMELSNELIIDTVERGDLDHLFKPAPPEMFQKFMDGELIGTRTTTVMLPSKTISAAETRRRVDFQQAVAQGYVPTPA